MTDPNIPAPPKGIYHADAIIIYGVKLNETEAYARLGIGSGANLELQVQISSKEPEMSKSGTPDPEQSVVLAYGYGFEGHCYRLDTTRIFVVSGTKAETAVGCGFDNEPVSETVATAFQMWRIRASTELVEISTIFGDATALLLNPNLPGRKSPTSYAITQSMAHRDGRLTRD